MCRLDAGAREMIVERFLSNAENLTGGPDWLSRRPSSVRLGTGAAYCSVGSDSTKPQLVHMTSPVSASLPKLGFHSWDRRSVPLRPGVWSSARSSFVPAPGRPADSRLARVDPV